ncbi:MAG: bi-domain-containing oxidoreductase [Melioribacteraceae bacterium]|nr:bi-domain-containing oxidoreductase [Melioribacteraceae bacterium]
MRQLTQNLKDGKMELTEVPSPILQKGYILVKNHYSIISAGTEGKTVSDARKGYIAKAKSRQKEVKMVLDTVKTQGIKKTYEMVMNKLEALSPLGYSSSGVVIEVGESVAGYEVGDFVACGGSGASHSEIISVPVNLCVKVDKSIDLKHAAFTTVASIAMQGVRQSEVKLGESCVVIGLGLIGQLTIQILNAAGIKSIGVDISENQVQLAKRCGASFAINRNSDGIEQIIKSYTSGFGADAVIITAGTSSTDPVELAGRISRQKGKVVIVGAVSTGFNREHYYKKELDLRMSCSYGPGRYDNNYEEKGIDYPIGYVRWTENRNMQTFIELLKAGKILLEKLITHQFDFQDAPSAYEIILNKTVPFNGIVLKYPNEVSYEKKVIVCERKSYIETDVNIGFIGAGSFAQNMILPNIPNYANKVTVVTGHGHTSRSVAQKFGFDNAATVAEEVFNDKSINTIFITTRHNLHAENVINGLQNKKNVFVEKPLCLNERELDQIIDVYNSSGAKLMLGYNRRFAPQITQLKERLNDSVPKAINYRINAGYIPKDHWTQDLEIGGGRIIGEVCHFIDLTLFLSGSNINSVYSALLGSQENLSDTLNIQLTFENGSIASISYFSNGSKKLEKEYLEVFYAGNTYLLKDFKELESYTERVKKDKISSQNKGHKKEIELFIDSIKNGKPAPIKADEIFHTSRVTFNVIESIKTNSVIRC